MPQDGRREVRGGADELGEGGDALGVYDVLVVDAGLFECEADGLAAAWEVWPVWMKMVMVIRCVSSTE